MSSRERKPVSWRPQSFFSHQVHSVREIELLNQLGGMAVKFRSPRKSRPHLDVSGGQSCSMSLWTTQSITGFLTVPQLETDLFTIRFVNSCRMIRRNRSDEHLGSPGYAMFVPFDAMRNEEASADFSAISGTVTRSALMRSHQMLEGSPEAPFPDLVPVAPVDTLAMQSFRLCFERIYRRLQLADPEIDLLFPLLEEVVSYQLLSCWPRRPARARPAPLATSNAQLRRAMDHIDAHLAQPLRLADVATVAGVSVRTLQHNFRRELGITPLDYIIDRRLQKVKSDLSSENNIDVTVAELARRWGFVHISDFTQRYRKRFGCTPSETRRHDI
ncbi:helix-turn-helix transcriptional regulator [Methylobacterium oryzihabitans]|nr:helix-turn-helix transcriptional regulator [Methylobacterium oryzihabitans]